jgi:hypothetical protein
LTISFLDTEPCVPPSTDAWPRPRNSAGARPTGLHTLEDEMSDVGGVGSSSRQQFRDDEIDAMRKDESTSTIVNKARRDAGFKESDVAVRGDDRTLNEVLHEHHGEIGRGEAACGVIDGIHILEAVGVGEHAMHALGRAPLILLPVGAFVAGQYGMYETEKWKMEMKDGATRDQLHAAILVHLDVPTGFKQEEIAKLGVSMNKQGAASKISDQLELRDKPLAATLQLHCDQGMNAARTMLEAGGNKEAFLKAHADVAQRYAGDAAFHSGFDALCWAKDDSLKPGGDPSSYKAALESLNARDARYDAAHITYRM